MSMLTIKQSDLASVIQTTANFTKLASAFASKVAARDKEAAEQEKKAKELIPQAVEALIAHGRIDRSEAKEAAAVLADPVQCLELLKNMADPAAGIYNGPAGRGVDKNAGVGPTNPGSTADEVFDNILFGNG